MPGHRDITGATHERGTVRMSFRTKPRIKETIQRAAALLDGDDFVFTMNAAYKAAMETISAHEHTMPGPSIMRPFLAALDRPAAPSDRLRAAFARHSETIESR